MAPLDLAAAIAARGHFDELHGHSHGLTNEWRRFFESIEEDGLGDLNQRAASLGRQIRDNGVTYNVYSDTGGPQRPWSLDLFPLILSSNDWSHIERGVRQRVRLLEQVMADVYGPQNLLERGLLPPALVQGHPGYVREMLGAQPVGGTRLHIAAFDLARAPDGQWRVVSQRTQAPSGLGYLLENRLAVSHLFAQAFQTMKVQRLAGTYRALLDRIKQISPGGADSHIALLTPGPYNETYFEHAYLARYLGLSLVQGADLIVRGEHLYLKTLKGLEPVHVLLKRVDDQYLDPLELRADSTLGVAGLMQVIRAGNVLVANAPGSGFLESPALMGFLPALSEHLLGEALALPSLPTWWCGERMAMDAALPRLAESAIKPTYPGSVHHGDFDAVMGHSLNPREIDEWAGRIALQGDDHTVQAYSALSQMPTWRGENGHGQLGLNSVILRVFAVADGLQSWRVLPGGLARVAGASNDIAAMQKGGSSADVWVLTQDSVDTTTLLTHTHSAQSVAQRKRLVTSRAGENLFWLGRYTERSENQIRLARLTLESLHGEDQSSVPLLTWLSQLASANTLVLPGVPPAQQARRVFERSLIAGLGSSELSTSVGFNLRALRMAAANVRERLSLEHWNLIVLCEEELSTAAAQFSQGVELPALLALQVLKAASDHLSAITGAQTDRMTRDDGWRLLSIGRHIERLGFLASSLARGFETGTVHTDGGFDAVVALFDSTTPFRAQFQQSNDIAALVDLLVLDRDNPRSLGWVAQTLRGRLAKLAGSDPQQLSELALRVPDPQNWALEQLCEPGADATYPQLLDLLRQCARAAFDVSEDVSQLYFTHSDDARQSLGF
jgi:uncharacterized circularly permuted ATP-grasp superfamily protein/uncharacterized alpha-E superfamily protein